MSRTVTLYGHWMCPFVHRVAWALAERGIDHSTVEVPRFRARRRKIRSVRGDVAS